MIVLLIKWFIDYIKVMDRSKCPEYDMIKQSYSLTLCFLFKARQFKSTKACFSPSARQVVITAGRPSGIAATAKATAILK